MKRLNAPEMLPGEFVTALAYRYRKSELYPSALSIQTEEQTAEKERFERAKEAAAQKLRILSEADKLFSAHLELIQDITLTERVFQKIAENKSAQAALRETIAELSDLFAAMDDEYIRERAADIRDVGRHLEEALKGAGQPELEMPEQEVIIAAKELFPSEIVKLNPVFVKGILMEEGGAASHAVILARARNIPVLTGVKGLLHSVQDGMLLCVDTAHGQVLVEPDEREREEFFQRKLLFEEERKRLAGLRICEPVTRDGKRIYLNANVGSVSEIRGALEKNADGVGLFRSEFLYLDNDHFPSEEEQFRAYKEAAELSPRELTIRTLDIGGDKQLSYCKFEKEENPFLGWRAIRLSLEWTDLFREQIRAILRAGYYGKVRILLPMIISLGELRQAKKLIEECKEELRSRGLPFDGKIEVGMLMETPASVLLAPEFAKEADFFSIGTNDLTQYLLAVDRGNKKVSALYDCFHPAVLEAVRLIIQAAKKENIHVSMCGEMAGDKKAVPLLLKMGLEEFSMTPSALDYVREEILNYP